MAGCATWSMYEFRLVREALAEREVLLRIAPHIVWPMRFVLPHRPEMRPRWMIRAGLFLYDHLARRVSLPGTESITHRPSPLWRAAEAGHHRRLRLFGLLGRGQPPGGAERRATPPRGAPRSGPHRLRRRRARRRGLDLPPARRRMAPRAPSRARALANAAGPWVLAGAGRGPCPRADRVRLIRGSHIVLPALYEGDQAYILQNDDRRVVFVIPYEGRFSPGRHHRCPARGRRARRALHAGGSGLSLRRSRPAVPRARRSPRRSSGPIPASVRCTTTAPTTPPPSHATTC